MKIKKYEVTDMKEALKLIKEDLGPEAVILTTRKIMKPTGLGLFPRPMLEVTAAINYNQKVSPQKTSEKVLVKQKKAVTPTQINPYDKATYSYKDFDSPPSFDDSYLPSTQTKAQAPTAPVIDMDKVASLISTLGLDKINNLASDINNIKQQLSELKANMSDATSLTIDLPNNLKDYYAKMVKNGFDEILAYRFLKNLTKTLPEGAGKAQIKDTILEKLNAVIPVEKEYLSALHNKIIAFIGPTGVGKTTSIAKIAADLVLKYSQKVCLITIDNFRIGAVEQLKTYAEIVNLPIYVATSVAEFENILKEIKSEFDYILLDSTGRSPYDTEKLNDMSNYLDVSEDVIPVLVLSMAANHAELGDMYEKFSSLEPKYIVFTKLDETRFFGPLANIPIKKKIPILLFSTGQNVPDDMETPDGKKIAMKLLQEIPTLWND